MNFTKSILFLEIFIFENTWENRCQNGNMIYLMNVIFFFFCILLRQDKYLKHQLTKTINVSINKKELDIFYTNILEKKKNNILLAGCNI